MSQLSTTTLKQTFHESNHCCCISPGTGKNTMCKYCTKTYATSSHLVLWNLQFTSHVALPEYVQTCKLHFLNSLLLYSSTYKHRHTLTYSLTHSHTHTKWDLQWQTVNSVHLKQGNIVKSALFCHNNCNNTYRIWCYSSVWVLASSSSANNESEKVTYISQCCTRVNKHIQLKQSQDTPG